LWARAFLTVSALRAHGASPDRHHLLAAQVGAGDRGGSASSWASEPLLMTSPPAHRPGPMSSTQSAVRMVSFVVLDDDQRVAQVWRSRTRVAMSLALSFW